MAVPAAPILTGTVAVSLAIGFIALAWSSVAKFLVLLGVWAFLAVIFVLLRHRQLRRAITESPVSIDSIARPDKLTGSYLLIVLGSGGHTKEMFAMMEINFPAVPGLHRRYVVSSGDAMSLKHLKAFEESLTATYGEEKAGSYDVHIVTRARKIHQPLYTVPISGLQSILDIFPLLLKSPFSGIRSRQKYPDIILINGPATGLFVGLAAWALRIFRVVPEEAAQILYVESWARTKTLSLTGLLFHLLGTTDVFLVQHEKVAQKYGVRNAGCLVLKQQARN
ncbi:UDP-N-acetylglucosamine transferase subunit ALG14 [Plectosphaerella plurivora]|uniref:UDP-N-acetylglucosamine transferase subunit ALG14 n=1 Tax=Plectosphaerella plurivora TaxID=936078 RepID=A0A9P8VMN9_9PEZI|nr:UDP-N-acetylglucosamine transferase subunit ALG14 [Plectosphaerella plurivora]